MRMGRLAQYKSVGRGLDYRRIDNDFFVKRTNGVGFDSLPTLVVGSLPNDVRVAEHLTENDNANIGWG